MHLKAFRFYFGNGSACKTESGNHEMQRTSLTGKYCLKILSQSTLEDFSLRHEKIFILASLS